MPVSEKLALSFVICEIIYRSNLGIGIVQTWNLNVLSVGLNNHKSGFLWQHHYQMAIPMIFSNNFYKSLIRTKGKD